MADFYDLPPVVNPDLAVPGSRDYAVLQWCDERLKRGIKFVESSIGYDKIDKTIREIFAYEKSSSASYIPGPKPLSQTRANLIAKIGEDLTADLTDTRLFWKYNTSNQKYEPQVRLANKTAEEWFNQHQISLRLGDVIRNYTIAGTGYAHLYYSRELGDMYLESEDPRHVYPIDPLSNHTLQTCRGVIVRRARTPDWVREEFDKVVTAEMGTPGGFFGWLQRVIEGPGERGGPLSKKSQADETIVGSPTVYVNTMYLRDPRTNKSGKTLRMGPWEDDKPTSPWSYEVKPNAPLFPLHRMVVWANGVLLYDDTAPYWHAKFPVIKFTLNPWPKSWFGKGPLWDCIPLQHSITANLRVIDDHAAQVAQPGAVADRNVSKAEMNKFNTRAPGYKIRTNLASGKGIMVQNPPPLDRIVWEVIQWCQEVMKTLAGTVDPGSMANLAQIPSDDTIDTIMKAMTPGIRLRSRILEGCYTELAEMYLGCVLEFDTISKRVAKFGPQAVTKEDFDYAGGDMIPDIVPDGEPGDVGSLLDAWQMDNPPRLMDRAKLLLMAIGCKFEPSSLLNTAASQDLMKYFLLAKMGYISVFTLMEKMGISNFAPPDLIIPPDEVSRLALQQQLGIGMIANAQGRKATDAAPPKMGNNANGPTITTS